MYSTPTRSLGRSILKSFFAIGVALSATTASADIIFDDGLTHELTGVHFDNVILRNRSDLNVGDGSFLQSPNSSPAVRNEHGGATINLNGNATVIGGIRYLNWGNDDDRVTASGSSLVVGGSGGGSALSGMRLVDLNESARLIGGYGDTRGGMAIENSTSGSVHVNISGGSAIGGNGGQIGGAGIGQFGADEGLGLNMTAGTIRGGYGVNTGGNGIGGNGFENPFGTVSGGQISGGNGGNTGGHGIYNQSYAGLSFEGGQVSGGNGGLYGGDTLHFRSADAVSLSISGGSFDAGIGSLEDGWLLYAFGRSIDIDITGGLFGYENMGKGLGIFNHATVDVFGWDLKFEDNWLTGYLSDGSWLDVQVSLLSSVFPGAGAGYLNLHNGFSTKSVPEPATFALLGIGLLGMRFAKRKAG
ncbi:PEP-CTERM sorting domain-containing protein [Woeseia oceani]|uniref:Ice-binding protein C-terminal domain-containing protein n=1 Tax=Woeseia oceani TaxID=1548547 RepID=A0A193LDA1_9GAMM|nr:PEP-CTERM sorting domain-containing protein [Woeseia oceani]ANO50487.1 hypothetical protein BA177_04010 [Woeseia oceani]